MQSDLEKFLTRIRIGEMDALGPLSDYAEEYGLPQAGRLRTIWEDWWENVSYRQKTGKSRRRLAVWEEIALWHQWARIEVSKAFRRKWKGMTLRQLEDRNPHLSVILPDREKTETGD